MTRRRQSTLSAREARLAWLLMAPALGLLTVMAVAPLLATIWESFFGHDLRLPWLGRPFVGAGNYLRPRRTHAFARRWRTRLCSRL